MPEMPAENSAGSPPYRSALANHPTVGSLIPMFVFRMADYVRQLEACLAAGDRERLARLAHQLKGAGQSYGFAPITYWAGRVEETARQPGATAELDAAVRSLVAYFRGVEGYRE